MIKRFCDICQTEITYSEDCVVEGAVNLGCSIGGVQGNLVEDGDYCLSCLKLIVNGLKQ